MHFLGIDGCRGGWLAAGTRDRKDWSLEFHPSLESLLLSLSLPYLALIDIPIGLPSKHPRSCDLQARKQLGPRCSSVFAPPCREAMRASNYREASRVNQENLGRKISIQTWNICAKIRETDDLLLRRPEIKNHWREAHPELTFQSMNGGRVLRHSKRTTAGREERLELLEIHFPPVRKWCVVVMEKFRRSGAGADNILDALALGMSAAELPGPLRPIPESPEKDSRGLPMRIWHPGR